MISRAASGEGCPIADRQLKSLINRLEAARARMEKAASEIKPIEAAICDYMRENDCETVIVGNRVIEYADDHVTIKRAQQVNQARPK